MSNSRYAEKREPSVPFRVNIGTVTIGVLITVAAVMSLCFRRLQNSIQVRVGPAFTNQRTQMSSPLKKTPHFLCAELKFYAANASRTWVMYLKTGQHPLAFAIASIRFLWNSKNLKQFKIMGIELKVGGCNPLVENLPVL